MPKKIKLKCYLQKTSKISTFINPTTVMIVLLIVGSLIKCVQKGVFK